MYIESLLIIIIPYLCYKYHINLLTVKDKYNIYININSQKELIHSDFYNEKEIEFVINQLTEICLIKDQNCLTNFSIENDYKNIEIFSVQKTQI